MEPPAKTTSPIHLLPYVELILAACLWGLGFVAAQWSLQVWGPFLVTAIRFLVGALFVDLLFRLLKKRLTYCIKEFFSLLPVGLFLFLLIGFQTWGLQITTATKSGFITVLYVLFIPLLDFLFHRTAFKKSLLFWIPLALLGTALICNFDFMSLYRDREPGAHSGFNIGDFLTFLCAIAAAFHFIWVSKMIRIVRHPATFHVYQSLWVGLFSGVISLLIHFLVPSFEPFDFTLKSQLIIQNIFYAFLGLGLLSFFSSGLAFLFQIHAQSKISPTTAGLVSLLESPFAMLFSILLLHENISGLQLLGAGLILMATLGEALTQVNQPTNC